MLRDGTRRRNGVVITRDGRPKTDEPRARDVRVVRGPRDLSKHDATVARRFRTVWNGLGLSRARKAVDDVCRDDTSSRAAYTRSHAVVPRRLRRRPVRDLRETTVVLTSAFFYNPHVFAADVYTPCFRCFCILFFLLVVFKSTRRPAQKSPHGIRESRFSRYRETID